MSEMIKEFNKGDLLHIDKDGKAQWGFPEGYPYKEQSETVIEWDGNTDGLVSVGGMLYRVSEEVIGNEALKNGTLTLDDGTVLNMSDWWERMSQNGMITDDYVMVVEGIAIVIRTPGIIIENLTFANTGVYFRKLSSGYTKSFTTESETIHPMAQEFLPQATLTTSGIVKQMSYLPNATGDAPTAENFNQLLRQLKNAGLMK